MKWLLVFTAALSTLSVNSNADRILVLAPVCSKSHKISFMPIAEALAEKGHQVTVVTPFPPLSDHTAKNLTEITVGNIFNDVSVDWFEIQRASTLKFLIGTMMQFRQIMKEGYDNLMKNEEFKKIIESRAADLIIVDAILNDFVLPIVDHFKVPFVFFCPSSGVHWVINAANAPQEYATVPTGLGDNHNEMTFMERLVNFLSGEVFLVLQKHFIFKMLDDYAKKDFPGSRPIAEIERDSQLCFINAHPATAWTRSLPPNVVPISALHTRPAKPLPQNLQTLADKADEGFIVFTLGSTIPVSSMPEQLVEIFVRVFSRIPQQVFWKWEKSSSLMDNLPENVHIFDWLPQQDLLGHSNARLFISHGGLLGIQETVYHGVPILGIPFGNDQRGNLAKARKEGYGLKLSWDGITEELLYDSIQTLLHNPNFKANATRLSNLMKDKPISGRELGAYWVEHILRHGGKHLTSPSKDMPLYQYFMVDVVLFLAVILCIVFFVELKLLMIVIRKLVNRYKIKRRVKTQ